MLRYIIHVRLLTEDGDVARPEDGSIWGQIKFEIMQRCRRKHKLLPSSTFCRGLNNKMFGQMYFVLRQILKLKQVNDSIE